VLLEAPWIDLSYSPWDVFHPGHRAVSVVVESPTIWIRRGKDGSIRLPEWKGGGKGGGGKSEAVEIQLRVHNGTVNKHAPLAPVRGLELDLLAALGGRTQAVVRRLAWADGPWNTGKLEVAGEVTAGDSVRAQLRSLRTASVEMSGLMTWRKQ